MKITRVNIGGFKNITEVNLSFDAVTALVGLNGCGKSNVITAIGFGLNFIRVPNHMKKAFMNLKDSIPLLRANAGKGYKFLIELTLESNQTSYCVEYSYSFMWGTMKSSAEIVSEILRVKQNAPGQKYNTYIHREKKEAFYKPSIKGRCDERTEIDENTLLVNKLVALDDLFFLDILKQINDIQFFIERHLDASPSFDFFPFVVKGLQELEMAGIQNIPRAIFFLQKDYPQKYKLLVNAFKQLFPNVSDIFVREIILNSKNPHENLLAKDVPFGYANVVYSLNIMDQRLIQPLNFEMLSDGTKRIFLMLTYAVIADINNLSFIAFEEPENSIHPKLFGDFLDILKQLVDNCKIVLTSHSPYIIQYVDPNGINIGMKGETGETKFRKIATSKVKAMMKDADDADRSFGDYLFDILSSDDADESIREYLEKDYGE